MPSTGSSDNRKEDHILDALHEQARKLHMARMLPDGELGWEWVQRIQEDFERFLKDTGYTLRKVSKKLGAGFSPPVLSQFRNMSGPDDYIGDRDRIVRKLNQFMEQEARNQAAPGPADFVETRVAKRMLTAIQNAIELRGIGLIYGPAGVGKTITLEAAVSIFAGSVMVRARSTTRSVGGFARHLAKAMKIKQQGTLYTLQDRFVEALKGTDRPIFIDEAHQLTRQALEFLRDLHDECGVPIILAGTVDLENQISDREHWFGQFSSRTALRYDIAEDWQPGGKSKALFTVAEIVKVFHSNKVRLTDDGALMLTQLANCLGLGGLRICRQVLFVAAQHQKDKPIGRDALTRVLRSMHGRVFTDHRVHREIDKLKDKVKVA